MRTVGLKALKNKLSDYVRLVYDGETFLIMDRDKVVAKLVPPQPGRSRLVADASLAEWCAKALWLPPYSEDRRCRNRLRSAAL